MERLKYFTNNNIDKTKWDEEISSSTFPIIYATSKYLDIVTDNSWGAYIFNDYEILIPVYIKQKFGIRLLIQPPFTQQLGIFSSIEVSEEQVNSIVLFLKNKHKFISLKLNQENASYLDESIITLHKTFVIDLNFDYNAIYKSYSKNTKRNIKKSINNGVVVKSITPKEFYKLFSSKIKSINFNKNDLPILLKLLNYSHSQDTTNILGAFKHDKLTAVAFWVEMYDRIISLAGISTDEGYQLRSMFLLHDYKINQNSGQNKIYDFEGSMIESIATFFAGFGSKSLYYPYLKQNSYSFPINIILK